MEGRVRELYQELVLEHNRNPRNFGSLVEYTNHCVGYNPFCGDKILVYLYVSDGFVEKVSFTGEGCAISQAAASMLTQLIKKKTVVETKWILDLYHKLLTNVGCKEEEIGKIGDLQVFSKVWQYPSRVKCAALCSKSIEAALEGKQESNAE